MNNLINTFSMWRDTGVHIVELQNKDRVPIAALYLDDLNLQTLAIYISKTSEKYYLYLNGVAIFFSYYKKVGD